MSIHDRGFASMSKERRHELASKGGRQVHAKGTGHEWTVAEAREAGRKGMLAMARKRAEQTTQDKSEPETIVSERSASNRV